jgi:hypothetical protein
MARNDIRPFRPGSGGTQNQVAYPLAGSQTFEEGEPVVLSGGSIQECATNPAVVAGISVGTSQGKDANGDDGTRPTGTLIQVYTPTDEQLFVTQNFATDGSGTPATPAQSNVGSQAGFTLDGSGGWYVDTNAVNKHVEIVAVLDGNGQPIGDTNVRTAGTGVSVVFVFLSN